MQKVWLRIVGLAGGVVFATFFALTFYVPSWVEDFAADFIEAEAAEQIDATIDGLEPPQGDSALTRLATTLYQQNQAEIERLKADLKLLVHEQMADLIAEIRDLSCECRDKYAEIFERGFQFEVALLQAANDQIVDFVQSTYMQVVDELKRDIRIFSGSNASVFLLLLVVSYLKPRAIAQLFVPGTLLVVATLICSYFYVFEQNWLLTIIYRDYLGYSYLGYLAIVFLFLCDVALNRARVTTEIVNAILNAVGSAANVTPC